MTHLSTLSLHRLRYGDLGPDQLSEAQRHLQACAHCQRRLQTQLRDRAEFVAMPVPAAIRELSGAPPSRARWASEIRGLVFALLGTSAVFLTVPALRTGAEPEAGVRVRGALPRVEAWVDSGAGPHLLRSGERLAAGDRVNLAYDPKGASAIAIAGRDSTGVIEVYTTDAPIGVGLVQAPFALALDDAPGLQEFFVVGSDAPLGVDDVRTAISAGTDGAWVARIAVEKTR